MIVRTSAVQPFAHNGVVRRALPNETPRGARGPSFSFHRINCVFTAVGARQCILLFPSFMPRAWIVMVGVRHHHSRALFWAKRQSACVAHLGNSECDVRRVCWIWVSNLLEPSAQISSAQFGHSEFVQFRRRTACDDEELHDFLFAISRRLE